MDPGTERYELKLKSTRRRGTRTLQSGEQSVWRRPVLWCQLNSASTAVAMVLEHAALLDCDSEAEASCSSAAGLCAEAATRELQAAQRRVRSCLTNLLTAAGASSALQGVVAAELTGTDEGTHSPGGPSPKEEPSRRNVTCSRVRY